MSTNKQIDEKESMITPSNSLFASFYSPVVKPEMYSTGHQHIETATWQLAYVGQFEQ